ncbi:MAG TPA: YlxR family protein [Candidatus Dormibacteraeota bacterium]
MPRRAPELPARAVPQRTCVACRRSRSKTDLVRLVALESSVSVDRSGRATGRGAYLCREPACWSTAQRRRALERALELPMTSDDWRRLREGILM